MASRQTSLITLLSSEHGRMRREQRDIDKRDLQRALKYGIREKCWGQRWKIEYDGIIFITDASMRREVTAFPAPLKLAPLKLDDSSSHTKAREILEAQPERCASHTVLVVDNSGSMATHDINLHRDRQVAAYSVMAMEYVAEQLFNGTANNSDVVSLVEFRGTATVIFKREPVSWVLYNKLLNRRDTRIHVTRAQDRVFDIFDSNYLPALEQAEQLLQAGDHDSCGLALLFLSDGAPSDAHSLGLTPQGVKKRICDRISSLATKFGDRLDVKLIGFGNSYDDFSVLEGMATSVKAAIGEERAEFIYCEKTAHKMGTAISSMVTSVAETRTAIAVGGRTKRNVESEKETSVRDDWKFYPIINHFLYDPTIADWDRHRGLPYGAIRDTNIQVARQREWKRKLPPYLAVNSKHCGTGAERVAFRCQLSDTPDTSGFVLGSMVAKETNLVERIEENVEFHKTFCKTQNLAAHLANEFNKRLKALSDYDSKTVPLVSFLQCSVLVLQDDKWPRSSRGMLVEKMIDTTKHNWFKWNDNAGGIDGRPAHIPIDVDKEYEELVLNKKNETLVDAIIEEGSEEDEEDSEDDLSSDEEDFFEQHSTIADDDESEYKLAHKEADYLQAFTHFTYRFTNGQLMVCDLQGILDKTVCPPRFELTDPAIHYRSRKGRQTVFGRTDKGMAGIQLFFKTHKCTDICKLMQLSKKNKQWKKEWKESYAAKSKGRSGI